MEKIVDNKEQEEDYQDLKKEEEAKDEKVVEQNVEGE